MTSEVRSQNMIQVSPDSLGTLAFGDLSFRVISLIALRSPCCEEPKLAPVERPHGEDLRHMAKQRGPESPAAPAPAVSAPATDS